MNNYEGRISKAQAKKYWDQDKKFVMVPCKMSPCTDSPFSMAFLIDPKHCKKEYGDEASFENLETQCTIYNCNYETGYYLAYYEEQTL